MHKGTTQSECSENATRAEQPCPLRLRLWPAVLIVLLHLGASVTIILANATNAGTVIGMGVAPLAASLLLILWWLAFSRAPRWDRVLGVVFFVLACAGVVYGQRRDGIFLLMFAMPAMTIGLTALLALTGRLRWPLRRGLCVGFLLLVVAGSAAVRVNGFSGSMVPHLAWRWNTAAVEDLPAPQAAEVQRTADLPAHAVAGDWPGFRGEKRDGRLFGVQFATDWSTPPRELWRRKVGAGWSSFVAIGDYVFTQEQRGKDELVTCLRAETGEMVWANRTETRHNDGNGDGPRATPTFDRGRLYTQGATGVLQCLDAATGATIWKQDLATNPGNTHLGFGFSSSPLVAGDRVFVFTGGDEGKNVAALDRNSGAFLWTSGWKTAGYSSPQIALLAGVPQLLMASDAGIQSFDTDSGALLWEHAWKITADSRIVQPLVLDIAARSVPEEGQSGDGVLLGATGIMGTRLLRIKKNAAAWNAEEVYTSRKFRPYFNDFVLHENYCYGFDGTRLACMDPANGKVLWTSGRCGGQLLLLADMDLLLVLSERGEVMLVRAVPEAYNELSRFKAMEGKTWNHPVIAHGRLLVRNAEEAACYQLDAR